MCEETLSLGKCAHHCALHTPFTPSYPPATFPPALLIPVHHCLAALSNSLLYILYTIFFLAGRAQVSAGVRSPSHSSQLEGKDRA